jgi:hypothetical protein
MMIGIGLVGYEESRPLKAAIGKLARCRDDGFAVTLACRRDIDRQRNAASLNGNLDLDVANLLAAIVAARKPARRGATGSTIDDHGVGSRPRPRGEHRHHGQANHSSPQQPAGGWGALGATGKALADQGIALSGSATLLKVNQPEGFDCPGCAWPDPKHTSAFEFCENGAKAAAWEATAKRCTPEFFAAHTLEVLRKKSDFELEMQGRLTHPMPMTTPVTNTCR